MTKRLLTGVFVCALAAPAFAGPDWIEHGDAGSTLGTAQQVLGIGQVHTIEGSLSSSFSPASPDLEDVYLLRITSPTTVQFDLRSAGFDSMLWLFNVTQANEMFGLLASDNTPAGAGSFINGPAATDNTGALVVNPGVYALAVTGYNRRPESRTGDIFFFADRNETSGPDGPGGTNPFQDWVGEGATGSYLITLHGTGFYDAPAPGAGVLLLAGLAAVRRRRA